MPVRVEHSPREHEEIRDANRRTKKSKYVVGALCLSYHVTDTNSYSGAGWSKYYVDIPPCPDECECLIEITIRGKVQGSVDAEASDWGFGKAGASVSGRLYSSLCAEREELILASGDGAESIELSGKLGKDPGLDGKVVIKPGEGSIEKAISYTCGPKEFNQCYKDFSVTAEGSVNTHLNWACDEASEAKAVLKITHDCEIFAYHVCKRKRQLIFEWSEDSEGKCVYWRRSDLDREYEAELNKTKDKVRSQAGSARVQVASNVVIPRSVYQEIDKQFKARVTTKRTTKNDVLANLKNSFKRKTADPGSG